MLYLSENRAPRSAQLPAVAKKKKKLTGTMIDAAFSY
jgi:hypothetical protein